MTAQKLALLSFSTAPALVNKKETLDPPPFFWVSRELCLYLSDTRENLNTSKMLTAGFTAVRMKVALVKCTTNAGKLCSGMHVKRHIASSYIASSVHLPDQGALSAPAQRPAGICVCLSVPNWSGPENSLLWHYDYNESRHFPCLNSKGYKPSSAEFDLHFQWSPIDPGYPIHCSWYFNCSW